MLKSLQILRGPIVSLLCLLTAQGISTASAQDAVPTPTVDEAAKEKVTPAISEPAKEGWKLAEAGQFEDAETVYRKAAAKGDNDSRWLLAGLHLHKKLKKSSPERARDLLQTAADAGHRGAMFDYATLLQAGQFGQQDGEKAVFYFTQAAEAGHPHAQYIVGELAMNAPDKPDEKRALDWFTKAVAQGQRDAKYSLVRFHDQGLAGLPVDPVQGTKLCREAAVAGQMFAINDMGVRYQIGTGIARDDVAAIGWFTLGAQFNVPAAHVNLGSCYELGRGCRKDLTLTRKHYAAATRANHPIGTYLLGKLFEKGEGIKPEPVYAYLLYSKAADMTLQEAIDGRDRVKKTLSPDQIAQAEKLKASNFTPGL